MKITTIILLAVFMSLSISGCKKEKEMNFRLINSTQYDISSLDFSGTVVGANQEIKSGDSTEIIQAIYESRFRVTAKLLCVEINEFSGENEEKDFSLRPCQAVDNKEFKDQTRRIIISDNTTNDSITFNIRIE